MAEIALAGKDRADVAIELDVASGARCCGDKEQDHWADAPWFQRRSFTFQFTFSEAGRRLPETFVYLQERANFCCNHKGLWLRFMPPHITFGEDVNCPLREKYGRRFAEMHVIGRNDVACQYSGKGAAFVGQVCHLYVEILLRVSSDRVPQLRLGGFPVSVCAAGESNASTTIPARVRQRHFRLLHARRR